MVILNLKQPEGIKLPDGIYKASWTSNVVIVKHDESFQYNGIVFNTPIYVKGIDIPCEVNVENGHPSMKYL